MNDLSEIRKRKSRNRLQSVWYYANRQRAMDGSRAWVIRNPLRVRKNLKRWVEKNRDYLRAYKKIWMTENADKMRVARKKWALKNPGKDRMAKQKWQSKNRLYHNLYGKFWRKQNPSKCCDYAHRRRAKIIAAPVRLKGIPELYEFFRSCVHIRCFYCYRWVAGKDVHVDHKIPLARGGKHIAENLCAACQHCNQTKASKLISEWRPELVNTI